MKEVWLIRHGETEWNAQKRFQGHLDVPLSPVGIGQAFRLAQRLARSGQTFDSLHASDLKLPPGVELAVSPEETIAAVVPPEDVEKLAEEAAAEVAEPEVIKKGKEEEEE